MKTKRGLLQYIEFGLLLFILFCMQDLLIKAEDYGSSVACIDVDLQFAPMASFWVLMWLFPKILTYSLCFYQFVRIYERHSCYFIIRNSRRNDLYIIISKKVALMMICYLVIRILELSILGIFPHQWKDIGYILMEMLWILVLYLFSVCIWSLTRAQWVSMAVIAVLIVICFVSLLGSGENMFTQMLFIRSSDSMIAFAVMAIVLFILSMKMTLRFYDRGGK